MKTDSLLISARPPQPTNDGQFALYVICFSIVVLVAFWIWSNKRSGPTISVAEAKDRRTDDQVISQLQLMEVKFEAMVSDIKNTLIGDHRLLSQKVESIQAELTEFKQEVRRNLS